MTLFQKQLYLLPSFVATLTMCIGSTWLLQPTIEYLDLESTGVFIYLIADMGIILLFLIPRIRLLVDFQNFTEKSDHKKRPNNLFTTCLLLIISSYCFLPLAAVKWINELGGVQMVSGLNQNPNTRYIAIDSELLATLRPSAAQPVNFMKQHATYRYAYYVVFEPKDTAIRPEWLPSFYYFENEKTSTTDQNFQDSLQRIFRNKTTQYFRKIEANTDREKYYRKSYIGDIPTFYEKIESSYSREITSVSISLASLIIGTTLIYSLFIWLSPFNQDYVLRLKENRVPWWAILRDLKL